MRGIIFAALLGGCAGTASQQQLAETPAAQAPWRHPEAPPANGNDEDRQRLIQSFDDMDTTQRAYREVNGSESNPLPPSFGKKAPSQQAPKKKGPAVQATLPPKTTAPAAQAAAEQTPNN